MLRIFSFSIILLVIFSSCEEDFEITEPNNELPVIYAFLEHEDPWGYYGSEDTNFVVIDKTFLGSENKYDLALISDSVNYENYDNLKVSLQRISSLNPESNPIGEPIFLDYMPYKKDSGFFASDNNIVFYTTSPLMSERDMKIDPSPKSSDNFFYKLSVKIPGKEEAYATTKMIRGITEGFPLTRDVPYRKLNMSSYINGYTFDVNFTSNVDARIYKLKIRTFYYEKRDDGNVYLDYVDYHHPIEVVDEAKPSVGQTMKIRVRPTAYFKSFESALGDTTGVVWRVPKIVSKIDLEESIIISISLGSQETYVYNQLSMANFGDSQQRPIFNNITNGIGLFTSKWNYSKDNFVMVEGTVDSLATGLSTKNLKFMEKNFTINQNGLLNRHNVIKRYLDK